MKTLSSLNENFASTTSVVALTASSDSQDRMAKALERLGKLSQLDDLTRHKKKEESDAKGKGHGKGKGKGKRPSGPYLERDRLTASLVTGEVVEWKGKYGWIKPHVPVHHVKASAHKGRLYVHKVDLEWWVKALTPGSFCRFHVYVDANSLGAEECTELLDKDTDNVDEAGEWDISSWKEDDRKTSNWEDWKSSGWEDWKSSGRVAGENDSGELGGTQAGSSLQLRSKDNPPADRRRPPVPPPHPPSRHERSCSRRTAHLPDARRVERSQSRRQPRPISHHNHRGRSRSCSQPSSLLLRPSRHDRGRSSSLARTRCNQRSRSRRRSPPCRGRSHSRRRR